MSKKTLVSAITAALVVGAASTTFAAANPFSDVPADSWAYDAVSTLAADGVIDGYPDGTYQGQNTMTRYEMAQIVARAMAKTDLEKADKALVDKLAAEFAEDLIISAFVLLILKRNPITLNGAENFVIVIMISIVIPQLVMKLITKFYSVLNQKLISVIPAGQLMRV